MQGVRLWRHDTGKCGGDGAQKGGVCISARVRAWEVYGASRPGLQTMCGRCDTPPCDCARDVKRTGVVLVRGRTSALLHVPLRYS